MILMPTALYIKGWTVQTRVSISLTSIYKNLQSRYKISIHIYAKLVPDKHP